MTIQKLTDRTELKDLADPFSNLANAEDAACKAVRPNNRQTRLCISIVLLPPRKQHFFFGLAKWSSAA